MTKNVHELLSWLKTTKGLSYSEILEMGYGDEALRDGLVKRSISDRPGSRRRSGVAEELITLTDAGRKRLEPLTPP